jgi:hypothetical protein
LVLASSALWAPSPKEEGKRNVSVFGEGAIDCYLSFILCKLQKSSPLGEDLGGAYQVLGLKSFVSFRKTYVCLFRMDVCLQPLFVCFPNSDVCLWQFYVSFPKTYVCLGETDVSLQQS